MSFEQLDVDNQYKKAREKKESEATDRFFLEKQILRESSDLLDSLARKIAKEFWIEISEAKDIISGKTTGSLDGLKQSLSLERVTDFESAIQNAKISVENLSKKHRESLKNTLENTQYNIEKPDYISSKIFGEKLLSKAKNPQNFWDQLIWIPMWIWESGEAIVMYSYHLWKWIILSPYHFYLILTGQWTSKDFRDI